MSSQIGRTLKGQFLFKISSCCIKEVSHVVVKMIFIYLFIYSNTPKWQVNIFSWSLFFINLVINKEKLFSLLVWYKPWRFHMEANGKFQDWITYPICMDSDFCHTLHEKVISGGWWETGWFLTFKIGSLSTTSTQICTIYSCVAWLLIIPCWLNQLQESSTACQKLGSS